MISHAHRQFIKHYLHGKTRYGVHSPFVYNLVEQVLRNENVTPHLEAIDRCRTELFDDDTAITFTDMGAGSGNAGSTKVTRKIAEIAAKASIDLHYSKLLFHLCRYLGAKKCVEFGTNLGLGSASLLAFDDSEVRTIEGIEGLANRAKKVHRQLNVVDRIEIIVSPFDEQIPKVFQGFGPLDLVFIDGNHRYEPTIRYYESARTYAHNATCIIFDDIHWSKEMTKAWNFIRKREEVRLSIDLYRMGLVFFRKEQLRKEHFRLIY